MINFGVFIREGQRITRDRVQAALPHYCHCYRWANGRVFRHARRLRALLTSLLYKTISRLIAPHEKLTNKPIGLTTRSRADRLRRPLNATLDGATREPCLVKPQSCCSGFYLIALGANAVFDGLRYVPPLSGIGRKMTTISNEVPHGTSSEFQVASVLKASTVLLLEF